MKLAIFRTRDYVDMQADNSRYGAPFRPTQLPEAFFEENNGADNAEPETVPLLASEMAPSKGNSNEYRPTLGGENEVAKTLDGNESSGRRWGKDKEGTMRSRRSRAASEDSFGTKPESLKLAFDHPPKPTRARPKDLSSSGYRSIPSM